MVCVQEVLNKHVCIMAEFQGGLLKSKSCHVQWEFHSCKAKNWCWSYLRNHIWLPLYNSNGPALITFSLPSAIFSYISDNLWMMIWPELHKSHCNADLSFFSVLHISIQLHLILITLLLCQRLRIVSSSLVKAVHISHYIYHPPSTIEYNLQIDTVLLL